MYSSPDMIQAKLFYRPANCGEPKDVISNLRLRGAYRRATAHIDKGTYNNCCTIEADIAHEVELIVESSRASREA